MRRWVRRLGLGVVATGVVAAGLAVLGWLDGDGPMFPYDDPAIQG